MNGHASTILDGAEGPPARAKGTIFSYLLPQIGVIHSMRLVVSGFRCCLPLVLVPLVLRVLPAAAAAAAVVAYEHEDHMTAEDLKTCETMIPPPETTIAAQHMAVSFPSQDARYPPVGLSERGRRTDCLEYSSLNDGTGRDRLGIWGG